ncbi:MAG: YeeE/YedE family protein [Desulfobacterota bacterium]|nr:YeeE/YedE family protein [Thermodesulfobacteriota bacterium]
MKELLYGLITGIMFGFLLQRAQVLRYDKQIGALRFLDMTIVKFMLSAVMTGMVGIYILKDIGIASLSLKPTILGAVIPGGLVFGIGWGLLGYCPGTSIGAVAEGRIDGLWGVLGMLVGAGVYAELYPWFKNTLLTFGDFGKITVPQALGVGHWFIIPIVIIAGLLLLRWIESKNL